MLPKPQKKVNRLRCKPTLLWPLDRHFPGLLARTEEDIAEPKSVFKIYIIHFVEYFSSPQWQLLAIFPHLLITWGLCGGGLGFPQQPRQVVTLSRIPSLTSCQYAANSRHLVCSGSGAVVWSLGSIN